MHRGVEGLLFFYVRQSIFWKQNRPQAAMTARRSASRVARLYAPP